MCELAQLSDNAYYVVGKRKTASAKHIAAMAQTLGVNPYYYTGESDDKKPFTGEIMEGFMKKHIDKKPTAVKAKTANKKPAARKVAKPTAKNDSVLATIQLDNSVKMNKAVKNLSVDGAVLILQALSRKAEAGGNAEVLYDLIKRCLLT
jgi:hypothetical protein